MKSWKNWLIVIPARLGSTRLPRKPLADLAGKPLIVRVFERVAELERAGAQVVVATDSAEIMTECRKHKVRCEMTREDHPSGTDRVNEVASRHETKFILNIQGDEPFIEISDLEHLAIVMERANLPMGTLAVASTDHTAFTNPNVVKVVTDSTGRALYFSRAQIPYSRTGRESRPFLRHIGVYAFEKTALAKFCSLRKGNLEETESLEQLRALENGIPIHVAEAKHLTIGIDTPEDLREAREKFSV
jgi:3-deoxy-manno-octulosonate cytidylyltransferase (CMP-KDO synthetase)